ncbi:MAG: DUF952 domain-containing protein [Acidimicrobiales bacterium]
MQPKPINVFHISTPQAWQQAQLEGVYTHPSLEAEGFIHMSTRDELLATTERHYAGVVGLILLEVDTSALPDGALVWEMAPTVGREFPHSYGPIPTSAVVAVHPWDADASGGRQLPPEHRS